MSSSEAFVWIGFLGPFLVASLVILSARYPSAFNAVMSALKTLFAGRGGYDPGAGSNRNKFEKRNQP